MTPTLDSDPDKTVIEDNYEAQLPLGFSYYRLPTNQYT